MGLLMVGDGMQVGVKRKRGRPRKKVCVEVGGSVSKISITEARKQLAEIEALEIELGRKAEEVKRSNPFWFFEPSRGEIGDEGREFLKRFLKEEDIPQRLDSQLDIIMSEASTLGTFGGNQCLGGEALIYDPIRGVYQRIDEIGSDFNVYAWDGEKIVITKALKPFKKEIDDLYKFRLSNGRSFVASMEHLILTQVKGYLPLRQVLEESLSFLQPTNSDICPSILDEDGRHFLKTVQDFQADYPVYCHFCGVLPQYALMGGQDVVPLSADVQEYTGHALTCAHISEHEDGQAHKQEYIHSYPLSAHPSNQDELNHHEGHDADFSHHNACRFLKPSYQLSQYKRPLPDVSDHLAQSIDEFALQANHAYSTKPLTITSDLVVISVAYERKDYKWDFTVPLYHNYYLGGVIHHNSGKSTIASVKRFIEVTGEVPISLEGIYPKERLRKDYGYCERVRIVGVDNKTLLNTVIPTYQKWCPREFLKKGSWIESFSTEQRTLSLYAPGRTGNEPIGSFEFMTNQQDVESFQGPPVHRINYDEEPRQAIRKENLMRFVTTERVNEMFCMTPTNGISWATDLFNGESMEEGTECYKLASITNKNANLAVLEQIIVALDSYEERKMRLLGETISISGLVYGKLFDRRIHVIEPFFEKLRPEQKKEYLCLTGLDPHLVTPTAMVFMLLDREGNTYVDRCHFKDGDTSEIKEAFHTVVREMGYRTGWSVADKSADSSIMAFGGRNIFRELSRGKDAIPALRTSEKFEGSVKAGVDEIKKRLKVDERTGRPRLFIVDRPETKSLITAFRTLERDTYANEDEKGLKDRIKEGRHHLHAAMRYLFQFPLNWYALMDNVPEPQYYDSASCW